MKADTKIFNDPVYGFITLPKGIILALIEHPHFQRLTRVRQLGMVNYVYPGANHSRFHHAMGAYHLMTQAIFTLRSKGVVITQEEETAACIAILLHDIGHGPFSHALEHQLLDIHHEDLTICFMEALNKEFGGELELAIEIFKGNYHKKFLNQLISGQLDVDRLDYLNRDSFYTGVSEGVIGYDRIIKMLDVKDNMLVVEEKGIYSLEKFIISRRLMYWQVYLHKTVVAAELMLIQIIKRVRKLKEIGIDVPIQGVLSEFLDTKYTLTDFKENPALIQKYARIDDSDIVFNIKQWQSHYDPILSILSEGIINRKLFQLKYNNCDLQSDEREKVRHTIVNKFGHDAIPYFLLEGRIENSAYTMEKEEIQILTKDREVIPLSNIWEIGHSTQINCKFYLCSIKIKA